MGYKIPVTARDRKREWSALRERLARERMQRELAADASAVRDKYALEREIARLEATPVKGHPPASQTPFRR